jgi:hypothetical protein
MTINLSMTLRDYMVRMRHHGNEDASMSLLMRPFGLAASSATSDDILVGYVMDDMAERHHPSATINFVEVAETAADLGLEGAETFLAEAPLMLLQLRMASDLTRSL